MTIETEEGVSISVPMGMPMAEMPSSLRAKDVTNKAIEKMARGFILGSQSHARRKEIRSTLEDHVEKRIGRRGKHLIDKLFELIEGVYILDKKAGPKGQDIRYYQVPPNLEAIKYAIDRVLGKPKQTTEHTEEKRGILVVENIIRNLAGDAPQQFDGQGQIVEGTTGGGAGTGGAG